MCGILCLTRRTVAAVMWRYSYPGAVHIGFTAKAECWKGAGAAVQGLPCHSREQVVRHEVDARGALRGAGGQGVARCPGLRGFGRTSKTCLTQLGEVQTHQALCCDHGWGAPGRGYNHGWGKSLSLERQA